MLLSALFNADHKEAVSGLEASVPPSGKGCGPWFPPVKPDRILPKKHAWGM